ncbi:hypothetical protein K461DRAFT_40171 [Myriangium duriaei CBS 260.36]|uniref:Uncharacterized protein n=1 Tax=Myriangium duriaei CBS 260.36 TaxID=1168546 RepID=A0A9P4IX03_9PEZI|nr:hypothetical protein K461DRAFT_40171 [Myriangium duriaei CBS 260.36]
MSSLIPQPVAGGSPSQSTTPSLSRLESLPTEILHHIFSYALLAEGHGRTKDPVIDKGPHYRLGTSLLLVNRSLGDQARAYLYTKNTFVLIRYQETSPFGLFLKKFNPVPFVSDNKLEDFTHYAMYINMWVVTIRGDDDSDVHEEDEEEDEDDDDSDIDIDEVDLSRAFRRLSPTPKRCHCGDCDPATKFSRILITHQHLHTFCTILQLCNHFDSGGHMVVQSGSTEHWHQPEPSQMGVVRVLVPKRLPGLPTLKAKDELHRQAKLLDPFQQICGGNQRCEYEVTGCKFTNLGVLNQLKRKGIEAVFAVSQDGMGWDLLKILRRLKALLDGVVRRARSGWSRLAIAYKTLAIQTLENSLAYQDLISIPDDTDDADAAVKSWQLGLVCLRRDCFLTAAQCQLRAGDDHAAWHNIDDAFSTTVMEESLRFPTLNKSYAILVHHYAIRDSHSHNEISLYDSGHVKSHLVRALKFDSTNNKIRKDLRTLKSCTEDIESSRLPQLIHSRLPSGTQHRNRHRHSGYAAHLAWYRRDVTGEKNGDDGKFPRKGPRPGRFLSR